MRAVMVKRSRLLLFVLALSLSVPAGAAAQRESTKPLTIEQTAVGNVFIQGSTPTFAVRSSASEIAWSVRDYWGRRVAQGSEPVSDGKVRLRVPVRRTGYYVLHVTGNGNDQDSTGQAAFALVPRPDTSDSDLGYGVQTHFAQGWSTKLVPLMKHIGVEFARDQQSWALIEKKKGVYDFSVLDGRLEKYMSALKKHGIEPLPNFGLANPHYDDGATPHTAEGREGYARFTKKVLQHYGQQIGELVVYNEPNLPTFGDHGDGPADATAENYYKLLRETYQSVKKVRPSVTVAGPELAAAEHNTNIWKPWLRKFFELGGMKYLDAVSVHPYRDRCCVPEGLTSQIAEIRDLMNKYGGADKPIWITELGWTTALVSEHNQAAYVPRSHVLAMAAGVEKFNWYNFMDHRTKAYGLIRRRTSPYGANTPKPSYVAYGVMTHQLSGLSHQGSDKTPSGVISHRFGSGQDEKHVMWAPGQAKNVALEVERPVRVTDMMGVTRTLYPTHGKVTLTLTSDPLYVRGDISSITASDRFAVQGEDSTVSETVPATARLNNTSQQQQSATFRVAGKSYQVQAAPGEAAERAFEVPSAGSVGRRTLFAEVSVGGKLTGLVSARVKIKHDVALRVSPRITDVAGHKGALAVEVANNGRSADRKVTRVDWKVGGEQGSRKVALTVPPSSTKVIQVELPSDVEYWRSHRAQATVRVADIGSLHRERRIGFSPVVHHSVKVDGDTAELANEPHINLARHGKVRRTDIGIPYEGAKDLSGGVWITADQKNLYVAMRVTDDTHVQNGESPSTWLGDGIKIGLAQGIPGETKQFYEYVVSLSPDGPKLRRTFAPEGESTGSKKHPLAVKRHEQKNVTTYELAIPWKAMKQIDSTDKVFSFSALVDDSDGPGREGWIEWGSGVGGGKDPAEYNTVTRVGQH